MTRLHDSTRGAGGHHPLNEWNYGSPRARALADKVLSGPGVGSMEALLGQVQRQVGDLDVQATPPVSRSGLPPRGGRDTFSDSWDIRSARPPAAAGANERARQKPGLALFCLRTPSPPRR